MGILCEAQLVIYLPSSNICDYNICKPFNHQNMCSPACKVAVYYMCNGVWAVGSRILYYRLYDKGISHLQGCLQGCLVQFYRRSAVLPLWCHDPFAIAIEANLATFALYSGVNFMYVWTFLLWLPRWLLSFSYCFQNLFVCSSVCFRNCCR